MKKYSGFTLMELLITLVIVAVVTSIGVPAFSDIIKSNRLTTQINTLVGHLAYARSEAVTRSQQVILCASSNMTSCIGGWADGWILFVDADNSSGFDIGEEILRVQQPLEGGSTLTSSIGTSFIYDSRGFSSITNIPMNGTFSLCDSRGVASMKSITISNTGRVRQGGAAAC